MPSYDPQLLKGVLSMLLLRLLEQNEDYGYAIVVRLNSLGFEGLAEGTVYPALTRLEKKGLVKSRLVPSESGPARKYYSPTPAGMAELAEAEAAWADLSVGVSNVMTSNSIQLTKTKQEL